MTESEEITAEPEKVTGRIVSITPLPPPQIQQGSQRVFPLYEPPKPSRFKKWFRWFGRANPAAQE